jgi:tryptophan-rich sensory protein
MQSKYIRFILFLIANFLALAIGVWLMNDGPRTSWYLTLQKAPWTPPNWLFGVAWMSIMFCFSFYMTKLSFAYQFLDRKLLIIYVLQWILNVGWNLVFFNLHLIDLGGVVIVLLWLLIGFITVIHLKSLKYYTLLIVPYLVWMTIAVSLNLYIIWNNA